MILGIRNQSDRSRDAPDPKKQAALDPENTDPAPLIEPSWNNGKHIASPFCLARKGKKGFTMNFPEVKNTETTVLIETPTYKSETWEYNQATHTEFRLTTNGGNTFSIVTYTAPQRGDETLHGTQEDCAALIADLADITDAEKRILAHYHDGFEDMPASEAIDPIEFFASQAENDQYVKDVETPGLLIEPEAFQ